MYEFFLAFFVFVTIYIDSLALLMKGVTDESQLAKVYVSSQALTYVTRFSLFFILPLVGLVLDAKVDFNLWLFLQIYSIALLIHSLIFLCKKHVFIQNVNELVLLYENSLFSFFKASLFNILTNKGNSIREKFKVNLSISMILYGLSHLFLSLIFPVLLTLGNSFPDNRAMFMGMTNVYTGVFSIYITFVIERKIPYLTNEKRSEYINDLTSIKVMSIALSFFIILLFSNISGIY